MWSLQQQPESFGVMEPYTSRLYPGHFNSLTVRNRGPLDIATIIKEADGVDDFRNRIKLEYTERAIQRISRRTKLQSRTRFWFLYKRCVVTGTKAKRVVNANLKGVANLKLNIDLFGSYNSTFSNDAMVYGAENEINGINQD